VKVVDANVLVNAVADESAAGSSARQAMREHSLAAPHIVDLEVVATLRRQHLRGLVTASAARRALARLARTSITRHHHASLLRRCWELRDNVKTYDAAYVALAEALGVPLLTADARLANAPGIRCEVELLT
jgi:predicted nucleic acid-binding protein